MPTKLLPPELLTHIFALAGVTPLDLVRLGGCSSTLLEKQDALAKVASQDVLWLPFSPPSAREAADRVPLSAAFVARMGQKEDKLRRNILAAYRNLAKDDNEPSGVIPCPASRSSSPIDFRMLADHEIESHVNAYANYLDDFDFCVTWAQSCCQFDFYYMGVAEQAVLRSKSVWLNDPAVLTLALKRCGRSIRFAGPNLFANETFLRASLLTPRCSTCWDNDQELWDSWAFPCERVAPALLNKRSFVESVLAVRPHSFARLPESLRSDPDLCLFAIGARKTLWPDGHKYHTWSDPEHFDENAEESNSSPICFAGILRDDPIYVLKAMAVDLSCLEDLCRTADGESLFDDSSFVVEALKLGQQQGQDRWTHQIFDLMEAYNKDAFLQRGNEMETMLLAVTRVDQLRYVGDSLRRDKVFCGQVGYNLGNSGALFLGVQSNSEP